MWSSLLSRCWSVLLMALAISPSAVLAAEAEKLLPAATDMILTLNLHRVLDDHKNTPFVQRHLEEWRLALRGDEKQLKEYYRDREVLKTEGITEAAFLQRARLLKTLGDTLGMDPLQDVDRITCGFKRGDASSFVVLVDGRFKEEKFRAAIKQLDRNFLGTFKVTKMGGVEIVQITVRATEVYVALLNGKTLAITGSRQGMEDLLARSAGKKESELSPGMRALLLKAEMEHLAFVMTNLDAVVKEAARFLEKDVPQYLQPENTVAKTVAKQVAEWLRKYGENVLSASVGLSIGDTASRLQYGLETKDAETARQLGKLIEQGNLLATVGLRAVDTELTRQLANIFFRTRVSVKGTTLVVQVEVPHELIQQVLKEFQQAGDVLTRRILSIPIWGPLQPPPPGAIQVEAMMDLPYRDDRQADPIRHRLDLFVPKGKKDFPVVVLVHGGGWIMGDNRCCGLYTTVGRFLASQGIGAVLPNYRLSPGVQHPEHIKDVARAVAWTRDNLAKYGGDPKRIFLMGHSAGGHLVSLLATDESYLRAEGMSGADIKGVVSVSGVYHIPPQPVDGTLGGSGPAAFWVDQLLPPRGSISLPEPPSMGIPLRLDPFGLAFGYDLKVREKASPVNHVHRGLTPFLIVVAERDLPTQAAQADEFVQALQNAGGDARFLKVAKRNHSSVMFSAISPDDTVGRAILEFVRKNDKK